MTPLERLREYGELTLVRGSWCEWEPGTDPPEWREVLAGVDGLRLVRDGLATITVGRGRRVLRPAQELAGEV